MIRFRDTNYYVDYDGSLYRNNKRLKPIKDKNGRRYFYVSIYHNGTQKIHSVHRNIAECLIPNPENKKQVNHINGDRYDNRVQNLEWCNQKENQTHAYKLGLQVPKRKYDIQQVIELHKQGHSGREIQRIINITTNSIYKVIKDYETRRISNTEPE